MKTRLAYIYYRHQPADVAGYVALPLHPKGREVSVGAARAKPPAIELSTPPPHVMADVRDYLLTVPSDGRLGYSIDGDGWAVDLIQPDPAPAVTRCLAARRVPNFAPYPYWGVGIYEARPRQEDGVWTWRAVDWAEPWTYPGRGQFQPRGYRSIAAVPLKAEAERLGLPIKAVSHGQKVSR